MLRYKAAAGVFQKAKYSSARVLVNDSNHRFRSTATVTASVSSDVDSLLAAAKPFNEIPSLPILPIIGSAWVYMPVIGRYDTQRLHKADQHKNAVYGDILREKFGPLNAVLTYRPEDMETIYKHEGQYPFRGEFNSIIVYRKSRKQWYQSLGLVAMNGKEWYYLRSKTQKFLLKPKAILAYVDPMQYVAKDLVKRIYEIRDDNKEVSDLLPELHKWALESVAFVGLDTRLGCLDSSLASDSDGVKMIKSVATMFETMLKLEIMPLWKYFPTPTWKKFTKASDIFSEIAFKCINRSVDFLKSNQNEDKELTLLQSMIITKGLDVSGAMATVADMIMAGIDTTSHAVSFLLYNLAKNPEKQQILYEEIKALLPNKSDMITTNTFSDLRFLKACIKETLRTHPIVRAIARTLDHDVVLSGYRVPAGTLIFCALQTASRSEKYFENANEFLPERWLNKDEKAINSFSTLPFGIGPRSCIGRRLSELEMICLTTEVIRNFKVEYHHEDIDMFTRLVNYPDKPLRFKFIER